MTKAQHAQALISVARRHVENAARHSNVSRNAELQHALHDAQEELSSAARVLARANLVLVRGSGNNAPA